NAVRRLVRALRLGNLQAERRVGISAAQLFVLQRIGRGRVLSLNEVAARTATDQSSVSVVVGRLVRRGLLSRRRSVEDGRRLEIAATPRGRRLLERAPGVVQHDLVRGIQGLPSRDRRQLGRLLHRLVAAMGFGERAPRMFFEDEEGPAPGRALSGRRPRRRRPSPR
ncbi:MAG TPA: MarR family winged helix-turn-helix transcriptional regulator, partial [Vicinamibacteria bacterium]